MTSAAVRTLDAMLQDILSAIPLPHRPFFHPQNTHTNASPPFTRPPAIPSSPIPPSRRQITVKHYSCSTPSQHCHICCRSSKNLKTFVCARVSERVCRKVICARCFEAFGWKWTSDWVCTHCRGACPRRSQCFTYVKSNERRRLKGVQKRERKNEKRVEDDGVVKKGGSIGLELGKKERPVGLIVHKQPLVQNKVVAGGTQ